MKSSSIRSALLAGAVALGVAACVAAPVSSQQVAEPARTPAAPAAPVDPNAPLMTNVRQLTFEGLRAGESYYSADGSQMIFQSEREAGNPFYQMYLMDMATGDVRRVSPGHGKTTCGWIRPDKKRVIFASTQDDPEARKKMADEIAFRASGQTRRYSWDYDPTYDIQEYDLATGKYVNLTHTLGYDAEGAYSPDGSHIVFASNRAAYSRTLSAAEKTQLERDPSYFMDLYVMNADGSHVRQITNTPGYDGGSFWSPDGRKIIWRRFSEDGARAEAYTINADGTGEKKITNLGAMSWAPIFHPSGDYIIFSTNLLGFDNFELYMVDAEGKHAAVRVTDRKGFDGLPMFNPDGRHIAWTSNGTANKTSQVFTADWDDTQARRLLGLDGKAAASAAAAPARPETTAAIAEADLRRHVEILASDAMEGRLTGTPGGDRAAAYVADAFKAYGLEPAGDNGGYLQAFEFTAGVSLGKGNSLTVKAGGAPLALSPDTDWRPLSFSRTGAAKAAPVVFAGYGLTARADGDNAEYDSYAHLDVAGKWVLVWRGVPNGVDSKARIHLTRFSEARYKASTASAHGAAGIIFAPAPGVTYADELPKLTYESASGASGLPVIAISAKTAQAMLAQSGADIGALAAKLDKGDMAAGLALPKVEVGANIDLTFERRKGFNVVGRLNAHAPANTPALVIGAHLDHLGHGETSGSLARGDEQGQIHHGADDNASGVAGLLEIAENLSAEQAAGQLQAKRDVIFTAWEGEELGLLGSSHFVEAAEKAAGVKDLSKAYSAYLNMDMIGRLKDALVMQGVGSSSVWTREIEQRNAMIGLPITAVADTYLPTDATSFYIAGVPILAAFTGAHEDYHSPRDTADRINYKGLHDVTRLMSLIARSQARADTAPDYIKVANTKSQGRVAGVYIGTIPDYAAEDVKGVALSGVVKGGPAEKAGVQGGDVIVGLGGAELANIYDYMQAMNGLKIGQAAELVVMRNGKRVTLTVTPAVRE